MRKYSIVANFDLCGFIYLISKQINVNIIINIYLSNSIWTPVSPPQRTPSTISAISSLSASSSHSSSLSRNHSGTVSVSATYINYITYFHTSKGPQEIIVITHMYKKSTKLISASPIADLKKNRHTK